MRRTHATLMNALGVEGKLVADQLGHTLTVNQKIYAQSPVALQQEAINRLKTLFRLNGVQMVFSTIFLLQ